MCVWHMQRKGSSLAICKTSQDYDQGQQSASMAAGPSYFDQLTSLQRWSALMGTGTTKSNLFVS